MKFQTEEVDDNAVLIKCDEIIAGSIARIGEHWRVEVLWTGPTGDIVYDAPSLPAALAFIAGVEKTMETLGAGSPPHLGAEPDTKTPPASLDRSELNWKRSPAPAFANYTLFETAVRNAALNAGVRWR
ncbi:hypothetical protein AB7G19_16260 [Bradyrhizobium sp. 215_C5_N1_1]|uniref:hypothetical protein n=1 Tax=unclassified Bradyrhizobium TaxID=2631580 RepID=UPI003F88737D